MVDFNSLKSGIQVVGVILLAVIGIFASSILGGVVIGVLGQTVASGDINVSTSMATALAGLETSYISTVTAVLGPITTIAALVIVVVLIAIFFGKKFGFGMSKSSGGIN